MLNVGLIGLGLTGSAIAKFLLEHRADCRVVMAGAGPQSPKAGQDLGMLIGSMPCGVTIAAGEDIPAVLRETRPHAVIDFSNPAATVGLLRHYAQIGAGVVVGTTGFNDHQLQQLQRAAGTQRFGLIYAPNITRGVNVLMMIARLAAGYLPGYDIEVIERHHRRKKDSPSGTAAKIAAQLHGTNGDGQMIYGRKGAVPREDGDIGVHAIRAGGIVGMHEVLFAGEFDEIVITHRAESRQAFAAGALEAAAWIATRRGYFTIEDMITALEVHELLGDAVVPLPAAQSAMTYV